MRIYGIVFCCVALLQTAFAQEEKQLSRNRDGFYVGVNFGGHIASDVPSQYYNGAPDKPNKATLILKNDYYITQLTYILQSTYTIAEYPTMKYDPNVTIGGHLGYNFSSKFSMFGEIYFTALTAKGNLKLKMDRVPTDKREFNTYKDCPIIGKEDRADINIGLRNMLSQQGWFLPFVEYGLNLNILKVKSHSLTVSSDYGSFTGNMLLVDNVYNYQLTQGGNGYGFFVTAGGLINMPSRVHLHVGVQVAAKTTGLNGVTGMNPHATIFIRCNY